MTKVARHNNIILDQVLVGKITATNKFYAAYNGACVLKPSQNVFYLIYHKTAGYTLRWIKGVPGLIPTQAVIGGRTADGFPLYVGRSYICSGSYDARKDCLDYEYYGHHCITDYYLLLLTSMTFINRFNFNFTHSKLYSVGISNCLNLKTIRLFS